MAQIYGLRALHVYPTGDLCIAVTVGDAECEPHAHGLRASRDLWIKITEAMAKADPTFRARLQAKLAT